jgi:hypothetical protein
MGPTRQEDCDHVMGLSPQRSETDRLVRSSEGVTPDDQFDYCPRCGAMLPPCIAALEAITVTLDGPHEGWAPGDEPLRYRYRDEASATWVYGIAMPRRYYYPSDAR